MKNAFIRQPLLNVAAACLLLTAIVGCGGPTDGRMNVTGTATIDGTPLPDGTVTFYKGSSSSGVGIITNGAFTVSESGGTDGMQSGTYQVAIQSWEVEPFAVGDDGQMGGPGKSRIPEKYNSSETSELTADISAENADVTFSLTSE